jgi:hypothetical protein
MSWICHVTAWRRAVRVPGTPGIGGQSRTPNYDQGHARRALEPRIADVGPADVLRDAIAGIPRARMPPMFGIVQRRVPVLDVLELLQQQGIATMLHAQPILPNSSTSYWDTWV